MFYHSSDWAHSKIMTGAQQEKLSSWTSSLVTSAGHWSLCYQKSTDGCHASTFHSKCNNYKNTIVVIRNSAGQVFGGTNVAKWSHASSGTSPHQMLFSLSLGVTMRKTSSQSSTACSMSSYGPTVSSVSGAVGPRMAARCTPPQYHGQ